MNSNAAYFINPIDLSLFKTISKLARRIRKSIVLTSFILLWVNNACAHELLWSEKFGSYSNVTAQFNVASAPSGSKSINQTVISVYSSVDCSGTPASSTLTGGYNFTFQSGQSYSVNATSFYQACTTYLYSDGRCGNGTIHSVKIQPRITGANIFRPTQPCFTVDATSGTKIVLTGAAANVTFVS